MLSVNGVKQSYSLVLDKKQKNQHIAQRLDLQNMNVSVGDLLSYHIVVDDNRLPKANTVRSEIFFVEIAEEINARIVVIGNIGRSSLETILLGSVAERVVRHCNAPVAVIKMPAGAASG